MPFLNIYTKLNELHPAYWVWGGGEIVKEPKILRNTANQKKN